MPGPEHLWSGDWERESALADARRRPPGTPGGPPEETESHPRPRRRRLRLPWSAHRGRGAATALGVLALGVAGVLLALAAIDHSRRRVASPGAGGAAQVTRTASTRAFTVPGSPPRTAASGGSRPVRWLGMTVGQSPGGRLIVEAVTVGGAGDDAGLAVGDTLLRVAGRIPSSPGSLARTLIGPRSASRITVRFRRDGRTFERSIRLVGSSADRP